MQLEAGILGVGFCGEPVGADLPDPPPFPDQAPVAEETARDLHAIELVEVGLGFRSDQIHPLPPHPGRDVLLFLADRVGVDRRGRELRMPHPLLEHVERNAVDRGVDPEAVAQALGRALRRVRYPSLDHDALDDLPDADAAERPDRCVGGLA